MKGMGDNAECGTMNNNKDIPERTKAFVGVTDNEWFAYVTLLKQDWHKAQGLRLTAIRFNRAKGKDVSLGAGPPVRHKDGGQVLNREFLFLLQAEG